MRHKIWTPIEYGPHLGQNTMGQVHILQQNMDPLSPYLAGPFSTGFILFDTSNKSSYLVVFLRVWFHKELVY